MLLRPAVLSIMTVLLVCNVCLSQEDQSPWTACITAGYAFFSPTDLNELLAGRSFPEIKGGLNLSGDIGYYVTKALSLHLTGGFMMAKSSSTTTFTTSSSPQVFTAEEQYRITALPIGLGVVLHVPLGPVKLGFGAFADMNIAGVEYKVEGTSSDGQYSTDRKESQLGGHIYFGPEFGLTKGLSLQLELGYQMVKITGLDGTQGFLPEKLSVDFSGTYGLAGLRYRF